MVIVLLMAAHTVGAGAGELVADMAALARHGVMQSHQRETGEVVVELIDPFPAVGDVTGGAHLHVWILVNVIRSVTRGAIAWQIILQGADMAIGTCQCLVMTRERETGLCSVIKLRLLPAGRGMASLTLLAVAPQMDVAVGMTAVAGGGDIFLDYAVGMTGATGQFRVMVAQWKIRSVVIENALFPAVYRMARITLLAVFSGMDIGSLVAAGTGGFLKLIALAGVTAAACYLRVFSSKIEAGNGMVELLAFLPALRRMAGFALGAQCALVEVILLVTARALRFRIAEFFALLVTIGARQGGVSTLQGEARPFMAECIYGNAHYVCIAAEVIGVTGIAGFDTRQRRLAVKAGFAVAVIADLIVTIEAQVGHGRLVEGRVAFFALSFEFGVTGNHIPRHQRPLLDGHFLCPGAATEKET